jgi:hypothetical protein
MKPSPTNPPDANASAKTHRRGILSMILALAAVALMTSVVAPAGAVGP